GPAGADRAELLEEEDPVTDRTVIGGIEERERGDVAQSEVEHAEDDRGQVGSLDLRIGELVAGEEVLLVVEPDADPGSEASASTGPLIRRGPAHPFDRQALDL